MVHLGRAAVEVRSATGGAPDGPPGSRPVHGRSAALIDDLVHAARSLRRSPGHVVFVVGTLAVGLGAATAVYSAVRHTLIHPLPYEGADRIVTLWRTVGSTGLISATREQGELWGGQQDLVEASIPLGGGQATLTGLGDPAVLNAPRVPADYFAFLGVQPHLGRAFVEEETLPGGPRSIILGHDVWMSRFGADPDVLGRTVQLDGEPWTVVGVAPPDAPLPTGFVGDPGAYRPLTPDDRVTTVIARLRPEATLEAYNERIDTLVARANADAAAPSPYGGRATQATQMMGSRLRSSLTTLGVAVGLLLLLACLNVSALLINRGDRRRHETAVRVALGVGRRRLARQHLLESLLLGGSAGILGVGVARLGLEAARFARPENLSALDRATLDTPVLAFALALSVGTALLFGLMPSLQAASATALDVLRSGIRGGRDTRRAARARWALVSAEVALSFALLVGSALLVRTMGAFQRIDIGFEAEGLVEAQVTLPRWKYPEAADREAVLDRLRSAVERLGGVRAVSLAGGIPPAMGVYFGTLEIEGREVPEDERQTPFFGAGIDPDYFDTLRQQVRAGRVFTDEDLRTEASIYVLGESTARTLFPDGDAVGARMRLGDDEWSTIVGVVADAPATGLDADRTAQRQLYTPRRPGSGPRLAVRTDGDSRAALGAIARALRAEVPDALVDVAEVPYRLGESVAAQRFTMRLLSLLAAVAAGLAALGLYGVVAQAVGRRTREIGIRMSLGARTDSILWMVMRAGATALVLGMVGGVALSLAGARIIESQLYGVEAADPLSLGAAAAVLGVASLLATWIPARRAARIDPLRAIASE